MLRTIPGSICLVALLLAGGCRRRPEPSASAIAGPELSGEWTLVGLGSEPVSALYGAGGRRVTMRIGADSARAGGFAGCNRFAASYTLSGDSLRFSEPALTRMACNQGMDLERKVTGALVAARTFHVTGTDLTLVGAAGPVAHFARGLY